MPGDDEDLGLPQRMESSGSGVFAAHKPQIDTDNMGDTLEDGSEEENERMYQMRSPSLDEADFGRELDPTEDPADVIQEHQRIYNECDIFHTNVVNDDSGRTIFLHDPNDRNVVYAKTQISSNNRMTINVNFNAICALPADKQSEVLGKIAQANKDKKFVVEKCGSIRNADALLANFKAGNLVFDSSSLPMHVTKHLEKLRDEQGVKIQFVNDQRNKARPL